MVFSGVNVVRPRSWKSDVADVGVGDVHRDRVAARAGRALRANDDVAREVADVRQEVQHAVQVARAQVIVLQRAGQRHGAAVGRDRLDGPLFPLVLRVDPAAAGGFALLDVPRVGQDEPVADLPARRPPPTASTSCARRAARWPGAVKVGVIGAPCIVTLPKFMRPVPNCSGSATPPPSGVLAMMISAVTFAAIGVAAVPTSR